MLHLFQDVFVLNSWIKSSVGCAWQCHQGLQPLCVLRPEGTSCGISAKMCKARYWSYAVRPSFSWLTSLRQALGCRVYTPNKRQQHGTPWCHLDLDAVDPFGLLGHATLAAPECSIGKQSMHTMDAPSGIMRFRHHGLNAQPRPLMVWAEHLNTL